MSEDDPTPNPEELLAADLAERDYASLDALAGELTELQIRRAEAYWKACTNEIFVRNRPEIIQQMAQIDATNLQTVILARALARRA